MKVAAVKLVEFICTPPMRWDKKWGKTDPLLKGRRNSKNATARGEMKKLSELVAADLIHLDWPGGAWDDCLNRVEAHLLQAGVIKKDCGLAANLRQPEKVQATCIGNGVALPHAYLPGIPQPLLLVGRTRTPLELPAPDSQPVDLLFLLIGPPTVQAMHLPTVARLVRLLKDFQWLEALRGAKTPEAVLSSVRSVELRHG